MKRYGMVIAIKPEKLELYKKMHIGEHIESREVFKEHLALLSKYNVRNFSIYFHDYKLFGYLEYHGDDFAKDMKKVGEAEASKRWWSFTDPCQEPLPTRKQGEWWAMMEEVFHLD